MSAGETLSKVLGGNLDASKREEGGTTYHKSPTTNSYGSCLDALSGQLTPATIGEARKMIEKHDKNSFHEKKVIGQIFEEEDGVRTCKSSKVLNVKGTYQYVFVAHLKTLEVWIAYEAIHN